MWVGNGDRRERGLGMASQESRESGHGSLKRDHCNIGTGHRFDDLNSEMVDGTYAQSSATKLPRVLLGVLHHLGKILPRGFGLYPNAIRESDVKGQRIEIPKGLLRGLLWTKSWIVD